MSYYLLEPIKNLYEAILQNYCQELNIWATLESQLSFSLIGLCGKIYTAWKQIIWSLKCLYYICLAVKPATFPKTLLQSKEGVHETSPQVPPQFLLICFNSILSLWIYCGKYHIRVKSCSICPFVTTLFIVARFICARQSSSRLNAVPLSADGIWGDVVFVDCNHCSL